MSDALSKCGTEGAIKFQFHTTAKKVVADSNWGTWIYVTNVQRQVGIVLAVIMSAFAVAVEIYFFIHSRRLAGDPLTLMYLSLLITVLVIGLIGFCVGYMIPRLLNWKMWRDSFLTLAAMPTEGEDGKVTVTFTEQGCVLDFRGETIERLRWKQILAIREWSGGWDFIECRSIFEIESALSLRKEDMIEEEAALFTTFIQQMSKKKCKPRAIELSELQRMFL